MRQHSAKAEDIVGSGGGKTGAFLSTSSSSSAGSSSGGGGSGGGSTSNSTPTGTNNGRNNTVTGNSINSSTGASSFVSVARNVQTMQSASAWAFQLLPELYNHYQKVADISFDVPPRYARNSLHLFSLLFLSSQPRTCARTRRRFLSFPL